jgi:PPK2 family polyphosphate:nucleotide phosphotransferase
MSKHLKPIELGTRPSLEDADAAAPAWAPSGGEQRKETEALIVRLGEIQASLYADGTRAVLVVLQGRDASGKDGLVRKVFSAFNPQGVQVTSFKAPSEIEGRHDFLWRIHLAVPPRGVVGIFNRSHYESVLVERVRGFAAPDVWRGRYAHINAFEQLLHDEGVVVAKFCLHVSREEQRKRLAERIEDPRKNWKFREGDLDDRLMWDQYTAAYQDAIAQCSTPWAPWYVVPADDKSTRDWLVANALVRLLEKVPLHPPVADAASIAKWRAALARS